ncbi:CG6379 [Drosophila busckii]|uniref:Cap-specific mRNA (nucleoside-2'-O-)-methyltransferase 1 n=1 Tax=Drosophila busckii TaxID=30019 RepID=A0A0M4ELP3_DROBS|nr:cap-specific mRNA (nucleoside-2'-O-)-methyltransferase 1 [Drosophila busckii]ALC48434.1 CG6379 [Drosophila busckii]
MESDDENFEPTPKKIKRDWLNSYCYSNKVMDMMKKMGYEDDKGLGKSKQGRLEPVIAVQQDGRRGFGLKIDTTQWATDKWDPNMEKIEIPETVEWLVNRGETCDNWTLQQLQEQIMSGDRKLTLDDETLFCDPVILHTILCAKTVFDDLNDAEKRRARARCNPFETIRGSIFQNRAAVKMANIDSMCDFMFTQPKDPAGHSLLREHDLLYFADMCAGPGGFSEYVLYCKSWQAKGFGFTLRGANDFKLDKFFAASPESFDAYYGVKEDGNIYDADNQQSLNDYIRRHTPHGVHFAMADGGFSVEGQENIQEILSKRLYLCQFLMAMKILREHGSFVCKLFDVFTPFSVGLVYLMYKSFRQISIIKPNSSRPANSERYIVCKHKLRQTQVVVDYMSHINELLEASANSDMDVLELISAQAMREDEQFMDYIIKSNNAIGNKQIVGLRKIAAFAHDTELKETCQAEVRAQCLERWHLPDKLRQAPEVKTTERLLAELLQDWFKERNWLQLPALELLSEQTLKANIQNVADWHFMPIGRGELNGCTLFLCKSRGHLLRYSEHRKWDLVNSGSFNVPARSLFFGEIVYEQCGEGKTSQSVPALHIMDAICLGGIDVRRRPYLERVAMCIKFAHSVNKPFKRDCNYGAIRAKPLYRLEHLSAFFNRMRRYVLKDNSQRYGYMMDSQKFFVPGGIMLFCELTSNYVTAFSRSRQQIYYFNTTTKTSLYKDQIQSSEVFASFKYCYSRRLVWKWTSTLQVDESASEELPKILYRSEFENFIQRRLHPQPQPQPH